MKAAIYCRVDQGGNAEMQHEALESQRIRLEEYALCHNIQITGYYEDCGYPGYLTDRPGLEQLIHDCLKGHFDTVLVLNHNRLYRGNRYKQPKWPFQIREINHLQQDMER